MALPYNPNLPPLAQTLRLLTTTPNEAAVAVLIPALDSESEAVQLGALKAVLDRRSPRGQREVLRRLHEAPPVWREIIKERPGKLSHALRDGLLGVDDAMGTTACEAILWFREYDLMPALITAAEEESNTRSALAAKTLIELASLLYEELSSSREFSHRRDPQRIRGYVTSALESSVQRFAKHRRTQIITAFLILANRDNATLKKILQDPHHSSYLPIVDGLLHSEHGGVVRLLLGYLDDTHAPSAAISVLARRSDRKFLLKLLRKIGYEPTNTATANLKRVENISWIKSDKLPVLDLDDAQQHSLVQLLMASSVKRTDIFEVIEQLLLRGKPGGRRAAAVALAQFNGAEANNLAVRALDDEDPNVQAAAVAQLRARGIPGALGRLIDSVDSIHEPVRQAARSSLSEFNFDRFQAAFDMLEEDVRQSTGVLVRKVNDDYVESLKREMGARSRIRRLRSIAMTVAMRAVPDVEDGLLDMLADDDHVVRTEAAKALAFAESPTAREALQEALGDRSTSVQEAAQQSLEQLGHAPTDQDAKPLAAIAAELASHTGRIM